MVAQAIGDGAPRRLTRPTQRLLEEAFGRRGIPSILDQGLEVDTMLVDRTPER